MSGWILILMEMVRLLLGMRLRVCRTTSRRSSGLFMRQAPYPSFMAHFCGQPQFRSTPLQQLFNQSNFVFVIAVSFHFTGTSYSATSSEASAKSLALLAANWTINGLSSEGGNQSVKGCFLYCVIQAGYLSPVFTSQCCLYLLWQQIQHPLIWTSVQTNQTLSWG